MNTAKNGAELDPCRRGHKHSNICVGLQGLPGQFLELALTGVIQIVTSAQLLDELQEKLSGKFALSINQLQAVRATLQRRAEVVTPQLALFVVKDDPDDDRVLECAVTANADYIVTGDRHPLRLGSYENIAIVTVRQFLNQLPDPPGRVC